MKQFTAFVRKEFYHILRDRRLLFILFGMPVVQVLLFGFALTNEVKNTRIAVLDEAKDAVSRALTEEVAASRYFELDRNLVSYGQMTRAFRKGKIKAIVVFPAGLAADMAHHGTGTVQLIADATDMNVAGQVTAYLQAIIGSYKPPHGEGGAGGDGGGDAAGSSRIIPVVRMLYNPGLEGAPEFVPGVMAMVLLLVCVMMTAVAIVKEKESGTMEVLLVSPLTPAQIILSKAVPYLILSLADLAAILLLSVYALHVPVRGSLALLLGESALFVVTCLMLGILISIQTDSQEVAMLISLVAMLLPTLMLSGFLFPIEDMPRALQLLSDIVPSKWYYRIARAVMIQGAGFSAVWKETAILGGITVALFAISLKRFKIRLQ
jgi:ABC-2 type transport system permease protein